MPAPAKSNENIQIEHLQQMIAHLVAEQKAKEAVVKELNTKIALAEEESVLKIQQAQELTERKKRELQAEIAPLEQMKEDMAGLKAQIASLKQERLDAAVEVKSSRSGEVKAANDKVAKATQQLNAIEIAIARCKATVAAL